MKNRFFNRLMIIALFCFVMPICGMDKGLVIEVNLASLNTSSLVYVCKELVGKTNKLLGISCLNNMPFLLLSDELGKYTNLSGYEKQELKHICNNEIPNGLGNIRYLPLSVFMDKGGSCKKKGDMLATVWNDEKQVILTLNSELGDNWIEPLLQNFKKQPNYAINLKGELIENRIIEEHDGKIIHGTQCYFKDEYKHLKTFFVGKKMIIASIMLLLAAAYAYYKNPAMAQSFF